MVRRNSVTKLLNKIKMKPIRYINARGITVEKESVRWGLKTALACGVSHTKQMGARHLVRVKIWCDIRSGLTFLDA
jgi:hypothetical protein